MFILLLRDATDVDVYAELNISDKIFSMQAALQLLRQNRKVAPLCLQSLRCASTAAASRNASFAALEDKDRNFFRKILGESNVITDTDALQPLNE